MNTLAVYCIGSGDLLKEIFDAVATVFNNQLGIKLITNLALVFGGLLTLIEYTKSRDLRKIYKFMGSYVLVTSLILLPTSTLVIEDAMDLTPRAVDHVPTVLAAIANVSSRIGMGVTQLVETVFHMPNDLKYNQTGMLMSAKMVLASRNFQISDPEFSATLNNFMSQCVFYDLLLKKYSLNELMHAPNPWQFIMDNTSVARAFPLDDEIVVCRDGAGRLNKIWNDKINDAASIYGPQILGGGSNLRDGGNMSPTTAKLSLLSRLSTSYQFLTQVSVDGSELLRTNLVASALSQGLTHFATSTNATAALNAYTDTKSELQVRQTLDSMGQQAGYWLQQFKNIMEAVLYSAFIFVYFLCFLPMGSRIFKNYLFGIAYLQSLGPMYAIVNFISSFYAEHKSIAFVGSTSANGLSLADIAGVNTICNDAMALSGYLSFVVTIYGAKLIYSGMPEVLSSMGQYVGGVIQNSASHVVAETVGGNISVGNTNFDTHSQFNTNANHFDENARYSSGMTSIQTGSGAHVSLTPDGHEVMNTSGAISNLGVSVHMAESLRDAYSEQAQSNYTAGLNKSHGAVNHVASAIRELDDVGHHQSWFENSGDSFSHHDNAGFVKSAHEVSQLVDTFAKEHHISHEQAAQLLAQVHLGVGVSVGGSYSGRSGFGGLYNEAQRFSQDHHFSEALDSAQRAAHESHYRTQSDEGNRLAHNFTNSLDKGLSYRDEASSYFSKADSYSHMASSTRENSSNINANYTQEFYEWLHHQKSPHSENSLSQAEISNMSIGELQGYADQFVDQKTHAQVNNFESTHIAPMKGGGIEHIYKNNNLQIASAEQVKSHYDVNQNKLLESNNDNFGSIDRNVKSTVKNELAHNTELLNEKQKNLEVDRISLHDNVHKRIQDRALGKPYREAPYVINQGLDKAESFIENLQQGERDGK